MKLPRKKKKRKEIDQKLNLCGIKDNIIYHCVSLDVREISGIYQKCEKKFKKEIEVFLIYEQKSKKETKAKQQQTWWRMPEQWVSLSRQPHGITEAKNSWLIDRKQEMKKNEESNLPRQPHPIIEAGSNDSGVLLTRSN